MHKILIMLTASALALGVMTKGAEARKRYYEIDGQRYSYDTRDPAQVALARQRIQAANAVDAAKAKAQAERSQNPLTAVFGSSAQREAEQAQARLKEVLTDDQKAEYMRSSRDRRTTARQRSARLNTKAEAVPAVKQAALQKRETASFAKPAVAAISPAVAEPLQQQTGMKKVKSVSFDVETGIKTIIMTDGSAEEEPFDSGVLSQLAPENGRSTSLTAFINRLRRAAPEETTGSVTPARASPPVSEAIARP